MSGLMMVGVVGSLMMVGVVSSLMMVGVVAGLMMLIGDVMGFVGGFC